ncbi:uncharacterized protein LOC106875689 [Octopus bimaculoides]|nr:uncharacterized protein LOC106875689 [Octopus bimaculoides]
MVMTSPVSAIAIMRHFKQLMSVSYGSTSPRLLVKVLVFLSIALLSAANSDDECTKTDSESSCCDISAELRDKWYFSGGNKTNFLRIRQRVMVTYDSANGKVRYKCEEKKNNVFLIRKKVYRPNKDGVLCLGFSYSRNNNNKPENTLVRYNSMRQSFHILSPELIPRDQPVSIDTQCDLLKTGGTKPTAALQRSAPGCRIPTDLRGEWRYTLKIARRLLVDVKYIGLVLLNNTVVRLNCESRDGNMFLFRAKNFDPGRHDALICLKVERLEYDPHYAYKLSRLNSGNVLHNQLRLINVNEPLQLHIHCDWIESPGIAEYLYPL